MTPRPQPTRRPKGRADPYAEIRESNIGYINAIILLAGQLMADYGSGFTTNMRHRFYDSLREIENAERMAARTPTPSRKKR